MLLKEMLKDYLEIFVISPWKRSLKFKFINRMRLETYFG